MKVAVIDNYDSFVFNLVRYLEEEGCELIVQRNDQVDFDLIESADAILLSPGPGIPKEAGDLMRVIDTFHKTKKILGVCLGHQALAEYFDGSIRPAKTPMHGKESNVQLQQPTDFFSGISSPFKVGRYHSWSVEQLPETFVSTAISEDDEVMAMEHTTLPIHGVQFHPESILTPDGRTMIRNWMKL